jgi:hypothetical protein
LLTGGSDLPQPWTIPGVSLHEEMDLLVGAGILAAEVIRIATRNGAEALGLLDEIGTVEAGKRADLLVLSADPTADIRNPRSIEVVIQGGQVLRPAELLDTTSAAGQESGAASDRLRSASEPLSWEGMDLGIGVIALREPDYDLEPIATAGEWMQVRVVVPWNCSGQPRSTEGIAWIRHLGASGPPLLRPPTRRC